VRVTLIHNPDAGSQPDGNAEKLARMLREAGHEVRLQSCKESNWARALQESADLVAVAGGDGTVARVAKAMVGRGIPVAPLPAGTANNISRTLGLVDRPWEELVAAWPEARRVKLDIGVARGPWGERYFIEGVGAGLFACLLSDSDPKRKPARHKGAEERVTHSLEMLKKRSVDCEAVEIAATLDGKDLSGRYLLFEALCILHIGPNLFLAPDSQPGDGTFDVVLVTEAERDRLTNYLTSWQENRERLSVLPSHRGKHLRIDWNGFELHIDDELWPEHGTQAPPGGAIDLRIGATTVEFIAPDSKKTE
jgi:diacylglycerol kinase family enzyme